MDERKERERKRKEALEEALEIAQKTANERTNKQKLLKQNMNENIKEKSKSPRKQEQTEEKHDNDEKQTNPTELNNTTKPPPTKDTNKSEEEISNTPRQLMSFRDNLALVLQSPLDTIQGMQFAVLMPTLGTSLPQALPIAVPIAVSAESNFQPVERTHNRILTPTQYRHKHFCDSSTQTDSLDSNRNDNDERFVREKMGGLDINDNRVRRKERGMKEEERPKWGVNKPQMRYLKQSEKDPLYQRRKIKQKIRQIKVYNDKYSNYSARSSDESQADSPVHYRKRERPSWRKNEQVFARNVSVYQTEIIPLESDRDQLYYKQHTHRCCCQCLSEKVVQKDNTRGHKNELVQCSSVGSIDSQAD